MESLPKSNKSEDELRLERGEKVVHFLDRIHAYEYIQDLVANTEKLEQVSFDAYKDVLVQLNGIARDLPILKRSFDGQGVQLKGFMSEAFLPRDEDKEALLEYSYAQIGKVKNKGDEAYMLASVINAVHLFEDGNGRTSRILYTLLSSPSKEEFQSRLQLALGVDGRYDTQDINPGLINYDIEELILEKHGWDFRMTKDNEKVSFKMGEVNTLVTIDDYDENYAYNQQKIEESEDEAKKLVELFNKNNPYLVTAVSEVLGKKSLLQGVLLKQGGDAYVVRERISPKKMQSVLEKEDWEDIFSKFYELDREQVKILVDMFVEPGEYKSVDKNIPLRDLFIEKINKEYKKNNS